MASRSEEGGAEDETSELPFTVSHYHGVHHLYYYQITYQDIAHLEGHAYRLLYRETCPSVKRMTSCHCLNDGCFGLRWSINMKSG